MTRLVVLISGRGSNMCSIVEACQSNTLAAEVVAVISNNPAAAGLDFASKQNIATEAIDHKTFDSRQAFDAQLQKSIDNYQPDLIVLAGFMRILGEDLVKRYLGKMVNIHPSLLPLHPGLDTHAKALAAGDKKHGASVHFVTPELDAGPVIAQAEVSVLENDTPQSLAARVLAEEHKLYVRALQLCVDGSAQFSA